MLDPRPMLTLAMLAAALVPGCRTADELRTPYTGVAHSEYYSGNLARHDAKAAIDAFQAGLERAGFAVDRTGPLELRVASRTQVVRGTWSEPTRTVIQNGPRRVVNIDRPFTPDEPRTLAWAQETATVLATADRHGKLDRLSHTLTVEPPELAAMPPAQGPTHARPGTRFHEAYLAIVHRLHAASEPLID